MLFVQLLVYLAVVVFLIAVGLKIRKYATAPVHLRWELYPMARDRERTGDSGSYLEEVNWWKQPIKKRLVAELIAMAEEIFLLKGVYHHNRSLWYASYPFHIGLYLLVGLIGLLVVGASAEIFGLSIAQGSSHWIGRALFCFTILSGYSGLTLALSGCIGLLVKRIKDPVLRQVTTPAEYVNLGYIVILLSTAISAWLFTDQTFSLSRQVVQSLLRFQTPAVSSTAITIELILFSGFLLYMPFTRMTHFFAKYFSYRKVRWENSPNLPGGIFEDRIREALNFGVSWQAPHIQRGKTWADVTTKLPK